MSNIAINTTQNVNLDYKIASIGDRMLAFLIDFFVLLVYGILLGYLSDLIDFAFDDNWTTMGLVSLFVLPAMCYSLLMQSLFNGRTVGKMIMNTRVVRVDGMPVNWSNYLIRWTLRLVDIWLLQAIVGVLAMLFTDKTQRLGDSAAGTVVISTKKKTKISHTILSEVEEEYIPTFTQVTLLMDEDIRLIKETLNIVVKSYDLKTLKVLREKVEGILQSDSSLPDKAYIELVLKDYTYFTQNI